MNSLWLKIQDRDGVRVFSDIANRYEALTFSTKLHGGYNELSLLYPCDFVEAFDWYDVRLGYRVTVMEADVVVWDGRLEESEITERGLSLTARGYWSSALDQVYNNNYTGGETASGILAAVRAAACPALANDDTELEDPGQAIANVNLKDNMHPADIFDKVVDVGGTAGDAWFWAVWGKTLHLHAKGTAVNWQCYLQDVAPGGISLKRSLRSVYNTVYAEYSNGGTRSVTAGTSDTASADRYGGTRSIYIAAGQVGTVVAAAAAATYLAEHKDTPQESALTLGGIVFGVGTANANGPAPLWRVKAGDVIRIADLVPNAAMVDNPQLDGLRCFFVRETQYDADANRLTITPDYPPNTADRILARATSGQGERVDKLLPYLARSA